MKRVPFSRVKYWQHFWIDDVEWQRIPIKDGGFNARRWDNHDELTIIRGSGIVKVAI